MIKNRTYTILVFLLFAFTLKAQEVQGPYLVFKLLKNTSLNLTFANNYQTNKLIIDSTENGELVLFGTKYDPKVDYIPSPGFVGNDTATYEYKDFKGKIKYISFVFEASNSYVGLVADVYSVNKNSDFQNFYPLLNDSSSIGSYTYLKINAVTAANNLQVTSPNDTTLRFKPSPNFTGLAYISYKVCDTFNTCEDGNVVVNVVDTLNLVSDSVYIGTPKAVSLSIALPLTGYSTSINPKKGTLEYNTDYSVLYKPVSTFTGFDTFAVVRNSIFKYVFVEVYNVKEPSKITVDDIVFTPKDSVVEFNVGDNDIVQKYSFLLDQNPSRGTLLKINNAGDFKYIPEAGYEGVQSFTYKVCPQGLCEYGEVKIFIGNWQPDVRDRYKFSTPKNVPLVFSYHIPIDAYNFSSAEDSVKFYPGYDTIIVKDSRNCPSTIVGYNQLVYYPPLNFAGVKSFTVTYCIPSTGQCIDAQCDVTIYDESKNCNKQCVGDCVWPGDVNLDGEVTMQDLLQIGYNLGSKGDARMYQSSGIFRSLKATDWNGSLPGSLTNLKHADADGNGKVDCADTSYISNFYRKQHSLVPKQVYDRGDFPFLLNILTPNADSGDVALIEIQLGDAANPAINLSGYAYELDYNTDVVDEQSLGINFYEQGWVTRNSALMHMYQKPWDGRIESGFIRSNGKKVSGKGGTEVLSFIVEDDLGGFRKGDQYLKVPFYFQNILVLDENGKYVQLPDQVAYINIRKKSTDPAVFDPSSLLVYPNPTSDLLNIHLNGKSQLLSIRLFTLDGSLVKEIESSDQKHEILNLQNLVNGLYLLRAETSLGPITKKVEILR
ncbi:MAG: Ig-like domain-containing protein [Saprospiraceae bacterium]|nr:T9SS type A sorting domain-containing protein [Saprospiraceae bacterium]MBK8484114.1 T9SS type A sorting domain-containing protein [Saprospiraceae bacterium]MBK9221518.1 T9SS type A sorting domain-containing protein [Saprospiraceae bacterium]